MRLSYRFGLIYAGLAVLLIAAYFAAWKLPIFHWSTAANLGPSPTSVANAFQLGFNTAQQQQGSSAQILSIHCQRPAGNLPNDYYCYIQLQNANTSVSCIYAEVQYSAQGYHVARSADCTRPGKPLPRPNQ